MQISKTKRSSPPFRIGDNVRIVVPKIFVRCGYPLSFDDVLERTEAEFGERIRTFCRELGFDTYVGSYANSSSVSINVTREIARAVMQRDGYGGRERTIHTADRPDLAGIEGTVCRQFFCKTGTYVPGSRSWSDGDHEPPYLEDEKTHRILVLDLPLPGCWNMPIEAANVEKIAAP